MLGACVVRTDEDSVLVHLHGPHHVRHLVLLPGPVLLDEGGDDAVVCFQTEV